mmetsp:Transcript_1948/g.2646  ORF Transcript_1948/g.2646 Transcript_1948/m.2646 type:complete len:176 (-) Transcript_1948:137-664(-)
MLLPTTAPSLSAIVVSIYNILSLYYYTSISSHLITNHFLLGSIHEKHTHRCYISLFAIILLMVEARLQIGVLKAGLLQMYFSRGFLFTFLGIIGQEEAYSGRITDMLQNAGDELHVAWAALFMQITSWALFSIGCIYLMGGLCCIKVLRDKLEKDHKKRVEEYKEIAKEIEDEEY